MAIAHFEQQVKYQLIDPKDPGLGGAGAAFPSALQRKHLRGDAYLLRHHRDRHYDEPAPRTGQVALMRAANPGEFVCKRTTFSDGQFVSLSNSWGLANHSHSLTAPARASDPTVHLTYETPLSQDLYGHALWSDLEWAQVDDSMPEAERRVEVSVQKSVEDAQGDFAGVLRVGLVKSLIDKAVQQHLTEGDAQDQHMIFLCDNAGRLITGFGDKGRVALSENDLRIPPADVPPIVARALREQALTQINGDAPTVAASFRFAEKDYLYTFQALPETQEWIVGVVGAPGLLSRPVAHDSQAGVGGFHAGDGGDFSCRQA